MMLFNYAEQAAMHGANAYISQFANSQEELERAVADMNKYRDIIAKEGEDTPGQLDAIDSVIFKVSDELATRAFEEVVLGVPDDGVNLPNGREWKDAINKVKDKQRGLFIVKPEEAKRDAE